MPYALLVGTDDGLYEITETDQERRLPGRSVSSLIPAQDGGWWAILDRRFVSRSGDGVEWREVAEFVDVEAACLATDGEHLWIGTFPPQLYRWAAEQLEYYEPFENVPGNEDWSTPWGGPPEVRSLAVAPVSSIFANVHVGGIPRSTDGGATWQPTIEVSTDVHQVLVHPDDPQFILAASGQGLGISRDGGDSWEMYREGVHGHYMSAVAVSGRTAFVSSSTGSSSNARSAIYRVDLDGPESFTKCDEGLPEWFTGNIDTFCLATNGDAVAFGTPEGDVFAADVRNLAWQQLASGLPEVRSLLIQAGSA